MSVGSLHAVKRSPAVNTAEQGLRQDVDPASRCGPALAKRAVALVASQELCLRCLEDTGGLRCWGSRGTLNKQVG